MPMSSLYEGKRNEQASDDLRMNEGKRSCLLPECDCRLSSPEFCPSRPLRSRNVPSRRNAHRALFSRGRSIQRSIKPDTKFFIGCLDLFFDRGGAFELLWCEIKYVHSERLQHRISSNSSAALSFVGPSRRVRLRYGSN